MKQLEEILNQVLNWELMDITLSNRKKAGEIQKIKVRPVIIKDKLVFQAAQYTKTQVFHKNIEEDQAKAWLLDNIQNAFKQTLIKAGDKEYTVLSGKKGNVTVKERKASNCKKADKQDLSHNRKKTYILPEGTPVPFLVDLGVMTCDGKIVRSKYDKYRQINRFLEFIQDILPELPKDRPLSIIDFGCGKSYLTFAMYYYLCICLGYEVKMTGLDLKMDVISHCNALKDKYGYEHLEFIHGDIADFDGADAVDMVVTLHACDTATDYALQKAIGWNARVILSVPCCQHELNRQIVNEELSPILQYGLLKERMSALITDGLRGQLLEIMGYKTQLLEFIDMEHTPKNILIRGVKTGISREKQKKALEAYRTCAAAVHGELTLFKLLQPSLEKEEEIKHG
ncbi:MAG: SAM-dependent methyltransferase [Clostridia bacterium]|nr:SAM-dependent methyltransferase [Lachnospiraceae bacterium]NCC00468.1 SAM-dependent methyltransferase [Clostridia bacterium]NCD02479.1 SAM-dependent methyltransferase [Clostridia bacterium]